MEFTVLSGMEAICSDLEEVSQQLQAEFKQSTQEPIAQFPHIIRRIEALQSTFNRIKEKSEVLISQREPVVMQALIQLMENKRMVHVADPTAENVDLTAASQALCTSAQSCSFLHSVDIESFSNKPFITSKVPATVSSKQAAETEDQAVFCLSEEEALQAEFDALPKHVRGHIKFADTMYILEKLNDAIDQIKADQVAAASKSVRQKKQAASRYSMKIPTKDLSKYIGPKASGKSGQAILLILRSLNTIRVDREFITVVDRTFASTATSISISGSTTS